MSAPSSSPWAPPPSAQSIRSIRSSPCATRYGFRIHVDAAYGGYFRLIPESLDETGPPRLRRHRPGRLHRHRPPQARPAALRLRLRPLSRPRRRPLLQARLAVHLLHFERATPRRDQPGVLPRRRRGRRPLGHAAASAATCPVAISPAVWPPAAAPPSSSTAACAPTARFNPLAAGPPELDIVVWKVQCRTLCRSKPPSLRAEIFDACAASNLHLALVQLPQSWFGLPASASRQPVAKPVTCLRSVLMKPEHEGWLDAIWAILTAAGQ